MAHKRIEIHGYVEIPEGAPLPPMGSKVSFKGDGEITGEGKKLTRKDTGEATITLTHRLTADPDSTSIGNVREPTGPLDEAIAGED